MSDHPMDFHDGLNKGVPPVTYGQGERPPRGDYRSARADYTCDQHWSRYTDADHALYRRLHARQCAQMKGLACQEFIDAVDCLGRPEQIPKFEEVNERLTLATGWSFRA
jgi:phenylalanine-4-hydroxylase